MVVSVVVAVVVVPVVTSYVVAAYLLMFRFQGGDYGGSEDQACGDLSNININSISLKLKLSRKARAIRKLTRERESELTN